MLLSVSRCAIYIYIRFIFFFITLQEKIDTVTVEGVENVGEEDCITVKIEEDYIRLWGTIKSEQEVSVLCCCVVVIYLQVCTWVLYFTLCLVVHSLQTCISHLFSFCMSISRMYLCDTFRLISVCVQIITYFRLPTPHHQLPSCLGQSVLMLCKDRWGWRGNR
jgi:hypothetical protein